MHNTTQHQQDDASHSDDVRVLRYLLHTIKGISPVSGGILQDDLELEPEYSYVDDSSARYEY